MEPLEAFQAAIVLDRPGCQYAVKAARSATTEPTKLDWMRMMRLAKFLTAHDELEWLYRAGCAGEIHGVRRPGGVRPENAEEHNRSS